jgi:hypothetical protein
MQKKTGPNGLFWIMKHQRHERVILQLTQKRHHTQQQIAGNDLEHTVVQINQMQVKPPKRITPVYPELTLTNSKYHFPADLHLHPFRPLDNIGILNQKY